MEKKENTFKDIISFSTIILILHYFLSWICNIKILDHLGIYARFSILTIEDIMFPIAKHNYGIMIKVLIIPVTFEVFFNILSFLRRLL